MGNVVKYIEGQDGQLYYFAAKEINKHVINSDIPPNAKLTDTTYKVLNSTATYTQEDIDKGLLIRPSYPSSDSEQDDNEELLFEDDVREEFLLNGKGNWSPKTAFTIQSEFIHGGECNGELVEGSIIVGRTQEEDPIYGNSVESNATYSFVGGVGNKATSPDQFIFGHFCDFNDSDFDDYILVVGGGKIQQEEQNVQILESDIIRKNMFAIRKDGEICFQMSNDVQTTSNYLLAFYNADSPKESLNAVTEMLREDI